MNVLKLAMITQLLCLPLALAAPSSLTFQGRIVKPDGVALEHNNVSFLFQITDPIGSCVLYQEQVNGYDMSNSGGVFDAPIGLGSRSFPVAGVFSVLDSFNNSAPLNCLGGSTYTPSLDDGRKLRVQFYDGSGWKLISPDNVIRSVPFAGYAASAARLGTNIASDFLLKAGLPTCGAGTFLSWSGTALSCAAVAGASGGTVTGVTSANGYITIINGTSTPQLTLQVGTAAGTVAAGDDTRFTNARVPSGSAGGDLSGSYPTPSVARMQGVAISAVAPTSGDFLKYNGTNWQGTAIAISDVTSLSTALNAKVNVSQFPASCAANQALTFSSPTGTFVCASIAITGAQVSGNIAGNAAGFTGALVGDVSGTQGATSVDKIKGVPLSMTGNGAGKVLTFDGTNWAPANPATSGTVSSVSSSNLYLSVATGTTTPALTVNVGTGANTVAAGNDSRIVNAIQNAGATVSIQSGLDAALPASSLNGKIYIATDTQKIYRDNGTTWVVIATASGGGGTVTSVASGTGLTGGPITGTGTLAVDVGITNGKILQLDGSARIPAVDGSLITNLSSGNLTGVVPVNKGGTGQSAFTDGQILIGNSTGSTLAPQVLTGDAAMTNAGLVTVNRIKGTPVSATPTTTGQVLRYDGTSWTPNFVSMFDLHSSVTGNAAFGGGGCTSNQTLVWTAATDSLACTNISLPVGQITGELPIAKGGTGVATTSQAFVFAGPASGGAGAPAFRALASTDLPSTVTNGLWTESSGNVYRATGNVGIGTAGPTQKLHVVGTGQIDSAEGASPLILKNSSNGGTWSMRLQGDGTTSNNFYIDNSNSGTTPLAIRSNGNVGVGTTTPFDKLTVNGMATFFTTINDHGVRIAADSTDAHAKLQFTNNAHNAEWGSVYSYSTGAIALNPSAGNVGIGTTNPGLKLDVATTGYARIYDGGTGNPGLIVGSSDGAASGVGLETRYRLGLDQAEVLSYNRGTSTYKPLYVDASKVVINSASGGNVGIGTTTPGFKLDLLGQARIADPGGPSLVLKDTNSTISTGGHSQYINFTDQSDAIVGTIGYGTSGQDLSLLNHNSGGGFNIYTASLPRVKVDSTGNVGIGTTTPGYKLDVVGGVNASSGYTQVSDIRLKTNLEYLDSKNALEKITSLRGIYYDWKDQEKFGEDHQVGLIAQDVQKVFPEAVKTNPEGFLSVSYSNLVAPVIESIKQLFKVSNEHTREIASIKAEKAAKDKEIKELNARLQKQNDRLTEQNSRLSDQNTQIQKQAKELEAIKKKLNL